MFVTFEGPEGGGKSTTLRTVADRLTEEGFPILTSREPGSGPVGAKIRELVLHAETLDRHAELFLFLADRANHVASIILPALSAGKVVLCDRFADSTIVYQGHARGLPVDVLRSFNLFATNGLKPDLTILLDLEAEVGLERIENKDRLDMEPLAFHKRVRAGFLAEVERDRQRWVVVDASRDPKSVADDVHAAIKSRM